MLPKISVATCGAILRRTLSFILAKPPAIPHTNLFGTLILFIRDGVWRNWTPFGSLRKAFVLRRFSYMLIAMPRDDKKHERP